MTAGIEAEVAAGVVANTLDLALGDLDLEWRTHDARLTFGAGAPEEASVAIWPCNEAAPLLFIGAEKVGQA